MKKANIFSSAVKASLIGALALAAGCASFELRQSDVFADEEGNVVGVDYGRRSKDHVFMVVSPGNGKLVEYKSDLMVRITLPDGNRISGYRTLNTFPVGTMYMTDDERWIYLANGFSCRIYMQLDDKSDYLLVFEGNLASAPKRGE